MIDRQSNTERDAESDKLMKEFLYKRRKITVCPPEARTENLLYKHSFYGSKKKKKEEE